MGKLTTRVGAMQSLTPLLLNTQVLAVQGI